MPKPLQDVRQLIHDGREIIHKAGDNIRGVAEEMRGLAGVPAETAPRGTSGAKEAQREPSPGVVGQVSDSDTLRYQLDHLLAPLIELETHLSEGCKIMGVPCDCCGKHAYQLRVFATETIPIASRMGKDVSIFNEIVAWTHRIEDIDTPEKVESGEYQATYQEESGAASRFRKRIQTMLKETESECTSCDEMRETLKGYLKKKG